MLPSAKEINQVNTGKSEQEHVNQGKSGGIGGFKLVLVKEYLLVQYYIKYNSKMDALQEGNHY